ncbi:MAG TPA: HIT domain-containing protein [Candidatus Saccharimonas sp.]|jgi:histidine triad (HIT) family protein|nr:HIT domain-containing protein [Candidatus Saccharimonas sp.]
MWWGYVEDCVFCRIAYLDPYRQVLRRLVGSVVFAPLNPCVPGHLLVVPKLHVKDASEDPDVTAEVYRDAARYVQERGGQANLITSIGPDATQTVWHLHVHIVPRSAGDGVLLPWSYQQHD